MDDYSTQDTSNFGDNYESNSYNYSDGNYQGYTHHYDVDKSNDFSPAQAYKSHELSDQNNISTNTYASSNNDSDLADTAQHSLSPDSQELTPQTEPENYNWSEQDNFKIDSSNQKDEYQSIINQEPRNNEGKFMDQSTESKDDSQCCCNEPLICLIGLLECFCL